MTDLDPEERQLLERLAREDGQSPAELALAIDADLETVYDVVDRLREQGLLDRQGFDSCRLTEAGRERIGTGRD